MALIKTVVLFLALLNAVLFLQSAVADEVAAPTATSHVVERTNSSAVTIGEDGYSHDDVVVAGDDSLGSLHAEDEDSSVDLLPDRGDVDVEEDADADLSEWSSSNEVDGEGEGEDEEEYLSPANPLARLLIAQASKKCRSKKICKKFFKKPGCCKKKCVNLAVDNKNCGKCGGLCKGGSTCIASKCVKPIRTSCGKHKKCVKGLTCCKGKCARLSTDSKNCGQCGKACDQKKGFVCKAGRCGKPAPTPSQCGLLKKCKRGKTCCMGKCVNLTGHNGHCGKCNKLCGHATVCCQGTCKSIKKDDRHCGSCGTSCGFAKKCCLGNCVNVWGSNKNHCGECGKKCTTTCKFGMCGYGQ